MQLPKGFGFTIIHAGYTFGWISNCGKCFKSKTNSADYHDEMISTHFLEWFEKQLISNIPPNSIIILDNAR